MSEPPVQVVRLDGESIDRLAEQLANHLSNRLAPATPDAPPAQRGPAEDRLLTAAQVSCWWGVSRSWIYRNADRLGALRLGNGSRPRLRFDRGKVAECLGERPETEPARAGRPPRARRPGDRPGCAGMRRDAHRLLPIYGEPELSSVHD